MKADKITEQNQIENIFHRHLNNSDVFAMFRRTLITVAVVIWLVFASCILGALIVRAQNDCPGLVVPYGRIANIRPQPNMIAAPLATLAANNSLPSHAAVNGWYPLCAGNYISESVARYMTNTSQPTRTPILETYVPLTKTPTPIIPTLTLQPTRTLPTPTRTVMQIIYCINAPEIIKIESGLWRVMCQYR